MTNAEKFTEIFGKEPAKYTVPFSCDGIYCKDCPHCLHGGCWGHNWWNQEYTQNN